MGVRAGGSVLFVELKRINSTGVPFSIVTTDDDFPFYPTSDLFRVTKSLYL